MLSIEENSTKNYFSFLAFFGQKTAKVDQKLRKLAKSKPFNDFFKNLAYRCFPTKENSTNKLFFDFGIFFTFLLPKKRQKLIKKEENR